MRGPNGFSFTEILVTVLVVALGIIPVFLVFSKGSMGTILSRDEMTAHIYAAELIDWCQTHRYDQLAECENHSVPELSLGGDCTSRIDDKYRRQLTVKALATPGGAGNWPMQYKVLTATIHWNSQGVERTFVMTGLLSRGRTP
ncbi:MAG TPA: hypothetical protein PKO06_13830 [Candidatus Ozemobacteraceae bacterium]|nr:hypothetical protein [Candidatus Ozemobacteraceae bacterium]